MAINKELMAHFEEMGKEREQTREEIERINNFEGDIDLYRSIDKQEAELEDIKKRVIQDISVKLLDDYPDNHFRITEGEEWDEFVESIRTAGIMTPLAVRKKGARYEVLSGHRRKKAAIEAGFDTVPCDVRIADDVEASVIVGTTNNYRKDISAREWGWAYRTTYEALKRTAGRKKSVNDNDPEKNGAKRWPHFRKVENRRYCGREIRHSRIIFLRIWLNVRISICNMVK